MFATSHLYGNHIWMTQFSGVDKKIANFMKSVNSKWLPIKIFDTFWLCLNVYLNQGVLGIV